MIGKWRAISSLSLSGLIVGMAIGMIMVTSAFAEGSKFTADVDHSDISLDDSVTLKFSIESGEGQVSDPTFTAGGFDVVNQYNAVSTESYYDESTGQIGMKTTYEVNKVLKPQRTGNFHIVNIRVQIGGKTLTAPDIAVNVTGSGGGTPPPQGYGGSGVGLRGSGKKSRFPSVFARAEVDKTKAYKGEQVIVSYYLYERARAFNIEITKYPTLNGFLREELEMPYLQQKLNMEQVVLDGTPYVRALLLRYAAYPLQEGSLDIDSLEMKYSYYSNQDAFGATDPMQAFNSFFQQALPGNSRSETLKVQVQPLPTEGRPNSFSGGVGDFDVVSAIDKTEVRANEPVTLTVKVEGHGNIASISEPKGKWPSNVELYDTKGIAKSGKGGVGQKTFEFLLIPREKGPLQLPGLEFSFFDPKKNAYVTKTTEPAKINVLEANPNSTSNYVPKSSAVGSSQTSQPAGSGKEEVRGLKVPTIGVAANGLSGLPMWRWLYWVCIAAFGFFALLVGRDLLVRASKSAQERSVDRARKNAKSWDRLKSKAKEAANGMAWPDVIQLYEGLSGQIFDAIERAHPVGSRSYSREDLRRMLVDERQMPEAVWERASRLLEFAELVRFASSAGAVSEGLARGEAGKWVQEAESIVRLIGRPIDSAH
jgi:hypothetical protein